MSENSFYVVVKSTFDISQIRDIINKDADAKKAFRKEGDIFQWIDLYWWMLTAEGDCVQNALLQNGYAPSGVRDFPDTVKRVGTVSEWNKPLTGWDPVSKTVPKEKEEENKSI